MDVLRLVAVADTEPGSPEDRIISVSVVQLAELEDGQRVVFDDTRGFSTSRSDGARADELWASARREDLEADVRLVIGPDAGDAEDEDEDEEDDEDNEFEYEYWWAAEKLRAMGVDVTAERLAELPFDVELTDALAARLGGSPRS